MKNKFKLLIGSLISISLLFTFSSCNDLEEISYSKITPDNFFNNSDELLSALTGVYDVLQDFNYYQKNMIIVVELPTEMMSNHRWYGSRGAFDFLWWNAGQVELDYIWMFAYDAVNRANMVIDRAPSIVMEEPLKKRIIAEAKFLRALNYFYIVRLWGDVPLVLKETTDFNDLYPTRSTKLQVYESIIDDLKYAIANLPNWQVFAGSPDEGRATSGAAKSLLGKVYLTMAGNPLKLTTYYKDAETILKDVIDNEGYGLLPEYADVFKFDSKNTEEHIFSIQFIGGLGEGSGLQDFFNPGDYFGNTSGWAGFTSEPEFIDQFDPSDKRLRQGFLYPYYVNNNGDTMKYLGPNWDCDYTRYYIDEGDTVWYGGSDWLGDSEGFDMPIINKYNEHETADDSPFNVPLLRYADVLLMYAEAINEQRGPNDAAYNAINEVRNRAGLDDLAGLTQEKLRRALINERKFELFGECHGYFDYVRKGILKSEMESIASNSVWGYPEEIEVNDFRNLMPIPTREIEVNTNLLPQNSGY